MNLNQFAFKWSDDDESRVLELMHMHFKITNLIWNS